MRRWIIAVVLGGVATLGAVAQQPTKPVTMKSLLLQGLRETHNEKAWFVSEKEAVAGLTAEQAAWSDGKNHSVGQLVAHLNYWNSSNFARLQKRPVKQVQNNDDTFAFEPKQWDATLKEFDRIMTELEDYVQSADDATLMKQGPMLAHIAEHNAYHIGEMVTSRKRQGTWNPENGVK
jgi:uncharacterized damage-inducible protein DinB